MTQGRQDAESQVIEFSFRSFLAPLRLLRLCVFSLFAFSVSHGSHITQGRQDAKPQALRFFAFAIAIAKSCSCDITAFSVSPPATANIPPSANKHFRPGRELLKDIRELGKREGLTVTTTIRVSRAAEHAILTQIRKGKHNLLVVGVNVRRGEELFFGHSLKSLLENAPCSMLIVSS
ncbi:MAG: hypothetical protein DMF61_14445 [Blastocatellia bacterium AA13]|nr:MAG: hypothetical protein DMF61_14445 [Blastocatellia bacterium AA13]